MIHATLMLVAFAGLPIPNTQACESAERLIQEIYGEQLEAARAPEQKAKLAREVLQVAREEPDPANKYVGLQTARRLATEALDGELALEAVQAQVATFVGELDGDTERALRRAELLWDSADNKRGREQLERRLEAVEYWLRAESESKLLQKKWEGRIEQIRGGGVVVLAAKDARLVGDELTYSEQHETILGWHNPAHFVEWEVSLKPGKYRFNLEYSGEGPGPESLFVVQILPQRGKTPIWQNALVLGPTGSWDQFRSRDIGTAAIRFENDFRIRFSVRRPSRANRMGLAIIKHMQIIPADQ